MAAWRSYSSMDEDKVRKGTLSRLSSATSIMDERYRESLQRHYRLLVTHIILTDDVIQHMAREKILPETMIKDIQDGDTREEMNERLLNALRLRGNKSYKRFRELMYRTGNFFVADLLWEEEDGQGWIDERDLAGSVPGLMGCVQEGQKRKLIQYLDSKIREKALLMAWKDCPQERIDILNGKVIDFNQEKGFRDTIAAQERKVKDLEIALKNEEDNRRNLKLEIASLQQQISALKRDHRSTLDTQSRFHDANMSTINRLKNKLSGCKSSVAALNGLVKTHIDDTGDKGDAYMEDEEDDVRVPVLERNVCQLIQQLKHEQDQAKHARNQCDEVLKLLNRGHTREPLVNVVKDVLKHEQKHRAIVMKEITRLGDTLRQVVPSSTLAPPASNNVPVEALSLPTAIDPATLDTKHFKSQLAMLRAESEHIKKRFQWKDSEAMSLRQELFSIKQRFEDYKVISQAAKSLVPNASSTTAKTSNSDQSVCGSCHRPLPQPINSKTESRQPDKTGPDHTNTPPTFLHPHPPPHSNVRNGPAPQHSNGVADAGMVNCDDLMMPDASGSRRSSIGRSDLDKMMVNVDQYLQDDEQEEEQESVFKSTSPKKTVPKKVERESKSRRVNKTNNALYDAHANRKLSQR